MGKVKTLEDLIRLMKVWHDMPKAGVDLTDYVIEPNDLQEVQSAARDEKNLIPTPKESK